jgi:hypothetical protein
VSVALRVANRKGAKDAKGDDFFRIGVGDSKRIPALRAISTYCRATYPQVSKVPPSATCRVVFWGRSPKGGAPDRLFFLADLRIGKRKLCVLGALSEAGGSSFSFDHNGNYFKKSFSYENCPLNRHEK